MQHFYVQFPSVGNGPDGKEISMEPVRWDRALRGNPGLPGYNPETLLRFTCASGPSTEDARSLNLCVNDDVTADDLWREFPTAQNIGPFSPKEAVPGLLPLSAAA